MRFRYSTDEKGRLVKKALVYTAEEHRINPGDVDPQAVFIVEQLRAAGFETYIVGGAVRDLILCKKPKDFDIVSAANPARIKKVFRNARIIGRRFRLVHVYFGPKIFEVSTFRSIKDGSVGNEFGTIEDDVLRRDFTLNALFYDPIKQIVVDFVGGMKDIRARKIRPIIPLSRIFIDDPVRMIRAVKYGASTGFKLPLSLRWKIQKQSSLLASVSPSRLTEEIYKIIYSSQAAAIASSLDTLGLYQYLQPQAVALFKTRPGFREQYLKTFSSLNQEGWEDLPGQALAGLIQDYLEDEADWAGDGENPAGTLSSRYKDAFMKARSFVLPMNPARVELDHAVRLLFSRHGVSIKRGRFNEHQPRNSAPGREGSKTHVPGRPEDDPGSGTSAKPSARKHRRNNSARPKNPLADNSGTKTAMDLVPGEPRQRIGSRPHKEREEGRVLHHGGGSSRQNRDSPAAKGQSPGAGIITSSEEGDLNP